MKQDHVAALKRYFDGAPIDAYQRCEVILQAGSSYEHIYFIESGVIKAYTINDDGECRIIALKGAGELMPLVTLFAEQWSDTYYEALTAVRLKKIPKVTFQDDVIRSPELSQAVLRSAVVSMREFEARMQNLEMKDARHRIIFRLLFMLRKFGSRKEGRGNVIGVPINYQDLADALNITRETANREFSKLIQEGLVEKRRNRVILRDYRRLAAALEA